MQVFRVFPELVECERAGLRVVLGLEDERVERVEGVQLAQ